MPSKISLFRTPKITTLVVLLLFAIAKIRSIACDKTEYYSRQFAVYFNCSTDAESERQAELVAQTYGFQKIGKLFDNIYEFYLPRISKRSITPHTESVDLIMNNRSFSIEKVSQLKHLNRKKRHIFFSDPKWQGMWYLNRGQGLDMNVIPVWEQNITGKGVVVTVLDDGLEKDHPDLEKNYDPLASYDMNNRTPDPSPRYDNYNSNRHGTRCAGEIAASKNNSFCALGIAFNVRIGGIRMLDGEVTDATEAKSLSLNPQYIDIYSASWGPDDDGKTVDGPGELALRAFTEGITKGRQGKGSIFVWASGNGGKDEDNCNCDGYTNSIYTLSIASATEAGQVPWYSEACSSTLATAYSSGIDREKQIITTDLNHTCTTTHTGTSASAPIAAAICALALEANPNLTWRDMQHIVIRSSRPEHLKAKDWKRNGVGKYVSHSFGFGMMDAYSMVELAKIWKTVPEQHKCEIIAPQKNKFIQPKSVIVLRVNAVECPNVEVLEHVVTTITVDAERRGDLNIQLISPSGTRVTLLAQRSQDVVKTGFNKWPFMSVHTWGENPIGIWQLEVHNEGRFLGPATLVNWSLRFYGSRNFSEHLLQNNLSVNSGNNANNKFNSNNSNHMRKKSMKKTSVTNKNVKEKKRPKNSRNIAKKIKSVVGESGAGTTVAIMAGAAAVAAAAAAAAAEATAAATVTDKRTIKNNSNQIVDNFFITEPVLLNYFVHNLQKHNNALKNDSSSFFSSSTTVPSTTKDLKNLKGLQEVKLTLFGSRKFANDSVNYSKNLLSNHVVFLNDSRDFYVDHSDKTSETNDHDDHNYMIPSRAVIIVLLPTYFFILFQLIPLPLFSFN